MPTGDRRSARGRALARSLSLAVIGGCLVACSTTPGDAPAAPAAVKAPADVVRALTRALDRRAAAVRRGDDQGFEAGLVRSAPRFQRSELTYFANLAQLPLAGFGYTLDPGSLVRAGDDYWVGVELTMQLEGYDDRPVTTPDRFLFSPTRRHPGRFVLASVTDRAWEERNQVHPQPWESGPIEVRTGSGVLGIFDPASVADADGIVSSVEQGISAVAAAVPYEWSRSVVVYALSDTAFLSTIDDLPGGDPARLDGVAFPVRSSADGGAIAATRFVLSPGMLGRPGPARDRLIRHELTHVAVGDRDDEAPVWLGEGLAEYVSVRPLAPQDRLISGDAVVAAGRGVTGLPPDDTFNDADSSAHYALAWWACEYVADSYGEPALWTLLDGLDAKGADQEAVLREQLGLGSRELARKAARLIVVTFDPKSLDPSESPSSSR